MYSILKIWPWHKHLTDTNNVPAQDAPADLGEYNIPQVKDLDLEHCCWWNLDCSVPILALLMVDQNLGYLHRIPQMAVRGAMDSSIGIAFRAGAWNDKADELDNASNKIRQYDYMINYWLSPNAVLKFDYENQKYYTDGKGTSGINVGVGYQF